MSTREPPGSEVTVHLCMGCGRIHFDWAIRPFGLRNGAAGKPPLILFQCRCGVTRAISWEEASERLQERAWKAQRDRAASRKRQRG